MFREAELAVLRRAYARQVTFLGNVCNANLERAYAEVPREAYLGPGPWPILRWPSYPPRPGYTPTPDADPAWLYADTLVGIVPERGLNNGQPSAHACWIAPPHRRRVSTWSMSGRVSVTTPRSWRTWWAPRGP